jgi:hypothetical protein
MQPIRSALVALAVFLAGCSAKGKPAASTAAAPPVVTVRAKDFEFEAPDSITAGWTTFRLVNDGPGLHHVQIIRLDSGRTVIDFIKATNKPGPMPAWVTFISGPNAPDPGHESNATIELAAGDYAMLCLIDIPDHMPHFAMGMVHEFTVRPASGTSAGASPAGAADVVLTLRDYSFSFSRPLVAGKQTIEVRTEATQPHEIEILKLAPGKTADDVMKWMAKPVGPPPASGIGGVSGTSAGVHVRFTADLAAGDYLIACFIPDAKDGKPHALKGMMQTIKIS